MSNASSLNVIYEMQKGGGWKQNIYYLSKYRNAQVISIPNMYVGKITKRKKIEPK